jgi:hypothetical protein
VAGLRDVTNASGGTGPRGQSRGRLPRQPTDNDPALQTLRSPMAVLSLAQDRGRAAAASSKRRSFSTPRMAICEASKVLLRRGPTRMTNIRNTPCPCNSGKKVRDCHRGQALDMLGIKVEPAAPSSMTPRQRNDLNRSLRGHPREPSATDRFLEELDERLAILKFKVKAGSNEAIVLMPSSYDTWDSEGNFRATVGSNVPELRHLEVPLRSADVEHAAWLRVCKQTS